MSTQTRAGLTWEDCLDNAASDAVVAELERRLGIHFPLDYLEVAKACQGGTPVERSEFVYRDADAGGPDWSGFAYLLPLEPTHEEGIVATMEKLAKDGKLPAGVVPIATDGGGDYVCLAYRAGAAPSIVYWCHERERDDSIFPLSDSFRGLLERLAPAAELPDDF